VHLEKLPVVDDTGDHVMHVVGTVRVLRHEGVEDRVHPAGIVRTRPARRRLEIVLRQIAQEAADQLEPVHVVLGDEVRHPAPAGMDLGSAQFLKGDILARHGLYHLRTRHKHIARAPDHDREVGDRR
jgi:hypothetical protein